MYVFFNTRQVFGGNYFNEILKNYFIDPVLQHLKVFSDNIRISCPLIYQLEI